MSTQIPWFEPLFDEMDIQAVADTVAGGFINAGPANRQFAQTVSEYFSAPHIQMTPSGTMALALSLMALGVGHGDTVLIPDLTFIGTASAVRLTGAEPILTDVHPATFVMDVEDAAQRVRSDTKAIIPVHLNGRSVDMQAVKTLAEKHGLAVVEDAAEALGSRNEHGLLGAQSDAGCFSFAPTKIISSGQGGFIVTHREDVRDQIIRLKDHGRLSRASDDHPVTGFNFKVTDIQAALALSQWSKLDARIKRVQEMDRRYCGALGALPQLECTARPSQGYLMWPDFKSAHRDQIVEDLKQADIHLRPFWPPIHTQPAYRDTSGFPGADEACSQGCWLPSSPSLTDTAIDTVIEHIERSLNR